MKKDKNGTISVRKTFMIQTSDVDDLLDIVHTVKSNGNYTYTQREALSEAIGLLKSQKKQEFGKILKSANV